MLQHRQMAAAPPKMARSRFSKALPSVPPFEDKTSLPSLPPVPTRDIPDLHFSPPAPLKEEDTRSFKSIVRKPITPKVTSTSATFDDFLPSSALPVQSPPTSSMAIPRRPIGGGSAQQQTDGPPPPPPKATSPRTYKGTSQSLAKAVVKPVPPEPSPTDSISSLISAYTSLRDEEPSRHRTAHSISNTTSRSRQLGHDMPVRRSPEHDDASPPPNAARNKTQSPLSAVKNDSTPRRQPSRPLPPPKDDKAQRLASSPPKELPATPAANVAPISPSTKRPEIWKRRPQNSETGREIPSLKLASSSGSTASAESVQTAVNLAASTYPASSTPKATTSTASQPKAGAQSRPAAAGLPGRNVRPAAKEQPGESKHKAMGAGSSKERRKDSTHNTNASDPKVELNPDLKPKPQPKPSHPPRVDSKRRPPTPEYRKSDEMATQEQYFNTLVTKPASPVSADTSPKDLSRAAQKDLPPQPPPHGSGTIKPAEEKKQTPTKEALGKTLDDMKQTPPKMALPRAAPDLRAASSTQELPVRGRSPPKEYPRNSGPRGADSARDSASSSGSRPRHPTESPRRPAMANTNDPRIVYSEAQGELYRGRDGTLYPEMKAVAQPDPKTSYFPIQTDEPAAPGTVFPSKPLRVAHFSCFQKHRTMNRRSNRNYPLTCQTCEKSDADDRWVCNFCHLRVCAACLEGLNGHQRELRRLVDQLRSNTPLSLSSMSRPASALGIELPG